MREPLIDRRPRAVRVGEHRRSRSRIGGPSAPSDLLRQADLAMYVAKEKGRARWELFDPSFAPHVMERLELEGDLWRAIEHGELDRAVPARGRARRPDGSSRPRRSCAGSTRRRGLLEPDAFVPFAEESSLIVAIDRFVLREACRWARRWSTDRADERSDRRERQPLAAVHAPGRRGRRHHVDARRDRRRSPTACRSRSPSAARSPTSR